MSPEIRFQKLLREVFAHRQKKNPRYSLRAFARSLNTDPSLLAKVLGGKRPAGRSFIERLSGHLGLDSDEIHRRVWASYSLEYEEIPLKTFREISSWAHFAILELMELKSFVPELTWIADALDLTKEEVMAIRDNLLRQKMISIDEEGVWHTESAGATSILPGGSTCADLESYQIETLNLAAKAVESVPVDERDHVTMTFAVDHEKIPLIRKELKLFRRRLIDLINEDANPDEVYNLNFALYPLTKLTTKGQRVDNGST